MVRDAGPFPFPCDIVNTPNLPAIPAGMNIVKEVSITVAKAKKVIQKKVSTAASKPAALTKKTAKNPAASSYTVKTVKEITATFPDSIGLTAKVAAAVARENVNILAGTGYSASGLRTKATFNLIVDDIVKAEKALDKIGADDIQEQSVIMVEMANKVGALERISKLIANAGINIYYFYATTSSGKTATCVIKTADDKKTIKVLREA